MGSDALEANYTTPRQTVADGEWAGWSWYPGGDPFEDLTGPFYFRTREDGAVICAFRAEAKHMNAGGFLHGGCVMTFADFALFLIARDAIAGTGTVTAAFNCELAGTARAGERVECAGEVIKAGRSLLFVRGLIVNASHGGEPIASFSAILKRTTLRR